MNLTHRIRLLRQSGWSRAHVVHAICATHPTLNRSYVRNLITHVDYDDQRKTIFKLERYQ